MRTSHNSISFVSLVFPLERPSLVHTTIVWCHTPAVRLYKLSGALTSCPEMNGRGIEAMRRWAVDNAARSYAVIAEDASQRGR